MSMFNFTGYECPHGEYGFYDSVSTIDDLMDQYGIKHDPWEDKNGANTYTYGQGADLMVPHPDYARSVHRFL